MTLPVMFAKVAVPTTPHLKCVAATALMTQQITMRMTTKAEPLAAMALMTRQITTRMTTTAEPLAAMALMTRQITTRTMIEVARAVTNVWVIAKAKSGKAASTLRPFSFRLRSNPG
jgi:hypothetical protein